jgi:hypothetical protein
MGKFDGGQLTNQERELRDFTNDFLIYSKSSSIDG